jgi:ParB family transcriptional regulator, chromosome partitioning protein
MSAKVIHIPSRDDEQPSVLAVEHARALLAEAKSLGDVADMRDKAAAMAHYARARAAGSEAHADAWEIMQLATRRIGELTRELPKAKGGRPSKTSDKPAEVSKPEALRSIGLTQRDANRAEQLAALPEPEFRARVDAGRARITKQAQPDTILAASAAAGYDGDEYGTPDEPYMTVVRKYLGGIDLDVASNAAANNIVRARRFFTKEDSALGRPWKARTLWFQPPFSEDLIKQFVEQLAAERAVRRFVAGVGLTNCDPSVGWYEALLRVSTAFCLVDHRIPFLLNGTPIRQNRYAQTFWCFGDDVAGFKRDFKQFGAVCKVLR